MLRVTHGTAVDQKSPELNVEELEEPRLFARASS
jgi:hypothetical protein